MRISRIELFKEAQKFSAGHFTIFSATDRERLHGHNFTVFCALEGRVSEIGMIADYRRFKQIIAATCARWNEVFLLPGQSPHLDIRREGEHVYARFDGTDIPFLAHDVLVLPVRNTTLEELSQLLLSRLLDDPAMAEVGEGLVGMEIRVGSGPGQCANAIWQRSEVSHV